MALDEIEGGDGMPPEPDWRRIFGRKDDRATAAIYWGEVLREMREASKLACVNGHAIKRLVVAYVTFDISAREVLRAGPVIKAKRTQVPTYNPWWTTMQNAASTAAGLEKELCISPRDRNAGGQVQRKARRKTGADSYLKSVGE